MADQETINYKVYDSFPLNELALGIKNIMDNAKCETQICNINSNSCVVQCRNDSKDGWWRNLTGNTKALSVSLTLNDSTLTIQIGNTEWGDKIAGYALAYFVFWPLAITATYGIYSQAQLRQQIKDYILSFVQQQTVVFSN